MGPLGEHLQKHGVSVETALRIVFQPQAVFRVRPVTRCSASLAGKPPVLQSSNRTLLLHPGRLPVKEMAGLDLGWGFNTANPHTSAGHESIQFLNLITSVQNKQILIPQLGTDARSLFGKSADGHDSVCGSGSGPMACNSGGPGGPLHPQLRRIWPFSGLHCPVVTSSEAV